MLQIACICKQLRAKYYGKTSKIMVGFPKNNIIIDKFGRKFDYLRISVIENCNLRCVYCMPEKGIDFQPRANLLKKEEIIRIVNIAAGMGISKIRYTGGEPLLRKDIVKIIAETKAIKGIDSVHLTTNGLLLNNMLQRFKNAGLDGINISLDTLNAKKFFQISRREGLDTVLNGFKQTIKLGFKSIKINMVVLRDFNVNELSDFAELTKENAITVRFIELMPFDAHQIWKTGHFYGVELMLKKFREMYPTMEVAEGSSTEHHIFRIPGYRGKFALIPSYTRSLCAGCTRIRLTADGRIRNCLYAEHEYNLLKIMRDGATDDQVVQFFKDAMWNKAKDGWAAQSQMHSNAEDLPRDSMTQIGG